MENNEINRTRLPKKSFLHKWKRQNRPLRITFLIVSLAFVISLAFFTISILKLASIETFIRVLILIVLYVHLIILLLGGTVLLFTKRNKMFVGLLVISSIFALGMDVASFYIDKTYAIIDSAQKKYVDYTSVMISMSETDSYKKIGIISAKDHPTGYIIPQEMIKENKIDGKLIEYDDYISMISDLYDGEIDALFIADGYVTSYNSYEKFANLQTETKVIYTKTKKMENVDNISYSTKNLTEPFTILLMGVDSTGDNISASSSFNGDSLMMITFNPKTLNATVFSIPRDTYVPITCADNRENKINASAYGGATCVVNTIENLTGIKIDYYAKVNFTGVVKLVDDMGGIEVDVPLDFCEQDSDRRFGEHLICLKKGPQRLNGEQALALARHRKTLPLGDFQRVQNQQLVVEGMVKELKNIGSVDEFYKILDDVVDNIDTNMTTPQILSLYNVGKNVLLGAINKNASLSIEKTYLTGYDLTMYMDSMRSYIYTFQYYKQSLEEIVDLMKVNLEIEKPKLIKTFSFDAEENYEKRITGKTYYNEPRRELMPNLLGLTGKEVENWALDRGIELEIVTQSSNQPDGIVLSQSEHVGKLVDTIDHLKIVVSEFDGTTNAPDDEDDNENDEKVLIPDFTGMTIQEFNKWKNNLKGANLITETIELTPEDILTLEGTELKKDTIYKQSSPKGTELSSISTLKVYYYNEES